MCALFVKNNAFSVPSFRGTLFLLFVQRELKRSA